MNYFFIIDVLVLIILALCLLGGLIKGFRKSLRQLIAVLIPTICLFIFLTPITNAVMNIKVDLAKFDTVVETIPDEFTEQTYSINDAISIIVSKNIYPDDATLQESSEVQKLASGISSIVVKIVVYFVGLILVWIVSLIIRLIIRIIFGKAKRKAKPLGLALGAVHFVIVFVLVLFPLFGTLSLTSSIIHDVSEYQMEDESMEQIVYYADLYENTITKKYFLNPITKVFCKNKTLSCDAQYVAGGLTFEVNDEKVVLLDEYLEVKEALPSVIKVVDVINELNSNEEKIVKLSTFTDEDIENISSIFRNSKLIRVVIPAVFEYTAYSSKGENSEIIYKMNSLNWNDEFIDIANLIDILKEYNDLEINVGQLDYIIKSDGVINLVEDLANQTFKMKLVTYILIPLGIEMLEEQFTSSEFAIYEIDFTGIKNIDWELNGPSFVTTFINVYKEYLKADIDFTNLLVALNDEKLPDFINYTFDEIKQSNIITDNLLPILMQVLLANLEQQESISDLGINFDELKAVNWKENLDSIKVLLHDLAISYQTLNIDPDDFKAVLKNDKLQKELDTAITNILNCEVFADYILPLVMNMVVDNLEKNESLASFEFDFDAIRTTTWTLELASFKDVFIEFLNAYQGLDYDKDEWTKILDNEFLATYINNIYAACKKSSLVSEHILPKLPNKLHELIDNLNSSIDISFLNELITEDSIDQLLTNDVDEIIDLLKEINKLGLFDNAELDYTDSLTQDTLINVVKKIFDLSVVDGKEGTIFESIVAITNLEEALLEYDITLQYDNVQNWDNEIDYICTIFKNIMILTGGLEEVDFTSLLTNVRTDEEKTLIAKTVAAIGYSDVFGDAIYNIFENVSTEIYPDCDIHLSDEEKNIIEKFNGWENETLHLLNLVEKLDAVDLDKNYEDLDATAIKDIMIYCSESVISTKVFGTVLNNIFVDVVYQDFTDQTVMKNSSDIVYNAIIVASLINDKNLDLNNKEVTNELVTSIKNIGSSIENLELTNQLINDIVGNETNVQYTLDDINNAADVVESIITTYQNSSDQDNFSLDDLSEEDLEKIDSSDLAKSILESLFN